MVADERDDDTLSRGRAWNMVRTLLAHPRMLDPYEGIVGDPEPPFGAVGGADAEAVGVRRDDVVEQDARVGGRLDPRVDRHAAAVRCVGHARVAIDRKSTRLNSSH